MAFADLSGFTALVTGGSRGIGYACAELLKGQGAQVVIHGSSDESAAKAAAELGVSGVGFDLLANDGVDGLVEKVNALLPGGVDILVNNAGITRDGLFLRMSDEAWDDVMAVNLKRVMQLTRAVLPGMTKKRFGRVINMASIVGFAGNVGQANYVASKAALVGVTKAVAAEVARRGVTVNAVAPGYIETDMTAGLGEEVKKHMLGSIPAQRFGTSAEVAAAVAFLASKEAAYLTGTTLHVNGGMFCG